MTGINRWEAYVDIPQRPAKLALVLHIRTKNNRPNLAAYKMVRLGKCR